MLKFLNGLDINHSDLVCMHFQGYTITGNYCDVEVFLRIFVAGGRGQNTLKLETLRVLLSIDLHFASISHIHFPRETLYEPQQSEM